MKICSMREAVRDLVRPGMHLHLALGQARPNLAIRALLERFAGTRPGFTVSGTGLGGAQLGPFLLTAGLVQRVETTFIGDQLPRPGPNRGANGALEQEGIEVSGWSLLTMLQRIQAGASGLEWTTTRSLVGSSLAEGNPDVRVLDDVVLIRSLRPDVTFLHGIVADEDGNTALSVPVGDALWAAIAARGGAIVSVERIVSREELRGLAGCPILPGCFVRALTELRHGAHPAGIFAPPPLEEYSYGEDYAFIIEAAAALSAPAAERERWVTERLLVGDLEGDYVAMLGAERLAQLDAWRSWPADVGPRPGPATPEERMAVAGARVIGRAVDTHDPSYVLAGIGISCLAVWLAQRRRERFPRLISELGLYDYDPVAGNPFLFYFPNLATAQAIVDAPTILGGMLGAHPERALAVVSAGQVDRHGNLNTTRTSRGWISGSGGANDIVSTSRTIALMLHRQGRLVPDVDYVTSPGRNVEAIVTDKAVLERDPASREFVVAGVVAEPGGEAAAVADVLESTPWPIAPAREVERYAPPTDEELATLRSFDPEGGVLGVPVA